ncbi:3-hydroxyacyl-CoA dehydrogenase family protein [Roseovarius dicentrarchi]|uniref:3-hydroxyacyl-CoA dehydrogenase family protein n=1 Tax=Roseovarius dicentrarchi TaxID=2250573 RepID=UPI000DE9C736|nr:3-hydroxyacyl-CoA dehydrogenase family protein [Roseovarius dicentrarchi]
MADWTCTHVAIVGAGLLGHAIGLVHAVGGCHVVLHDLSGDALDRAMDLVRSAADGIVEGGIHSRDEVNQAIARISTETDMAAALARADLVVEAIIEDAEAKREVFAQIDRHAPEQAVIASNTSYLDIFPLVPNRRQSRTMIVHWYTPPYAIDLVDVVRGPHTRPDLTDAMCSFLRGIGKKPVLLKQFINGYIANRIQTAISLEAFHLIDAGLATAEDIDTAIMHGLAGRLALMGHLRRIDYTGLKVTQMNLANKGYSPPVARGHADVVDRLVAENKLGVATGEGFYSYEGRTPAQLFKGRDRKLFALKRALTDIRKQE